MEKCKKGKDISLIKTGKVKQMVLDNLSSSLKDALKKLANAPRIDKEVINEVLNEIQRALIRADVNVKLVLKITEIVKKRSLTEKPPANMNSREHVIRIIYEELVKILGKEKEVPLKQQIIMMVGLYGQGKTTTAGKLAKYFQRRGLRSALIAGDTHRPAAYDQLKQIAEKINVPIYGNAKGKGDPVKIVKKGLKDFKDYDVIIIDTAGRHSLEGDLIEEMKKISLAVKPDEIFLVLDATVGQQAGPQAKAFHDAVGIMGVILTKLDGTAKGGGALSAVAETGAPIVFIGTGEHPEDLEKFAPSRFISRILGMGDLQTLMEKAKEVMNENKAEEVAKNIMSGKFSLIEMREQMEMLTKMGPLKKLMSLFPSFGKLSLPQGESLEETQNKLKKFRVIMNSMTDEELHNPRIIKSSRIKRIANGAGVKQKDVKDLLKYYNNSRKVIKNIQGNRRMRKQLMKQLKIQGIDDF